MNKHVDGKVLIFNKTVSNVLSNFIPHEVVVCDDKYPPCFNGKIKSLFTEKLSTYKAMLITKTDNIKSRKNLSYLQKSTKANWALLKIFLNNHKITVIPPLFHNYKFATDFKEKAEPFNSFFANAP